MTSTGAMDGPVVVITQEADSTADPVVSELRARDVRVVRFDTRDVPTRASVVASLGDDESWRAELRLDESSINLADARSVWLRRPTAFTMDRGLPPAQQSWARRETHRGFSGMLAATTGCLWVNRPERDAFADLKLVQLRLAKEIGLKIPNTLVTNDPEAARSFRQREPGGIIYKTFGTSQFLDERTLVAIYTAEVGEEDVRELARVKHSLCLFQEKLEKELELRVTVIGGSVFAAAVDSQSSPVTSLDWRKAPGAWRAYDLPAHVGASLQAMLARLGLAFGAFDLVLTPDGEYVFLELNPSGQWLWLQEQTGLPLVESMCDLLASGDTAVPWLTADEESNRHANVGAASGWGAEALP